MTEPELTQRVRDHYAARAFSPSLVDRLCREIGRRSGESGLEIAKGWWVPTRPLVETFAPIDQSTRPAILHSAPAAIFALGFGYRLDSPFDRHPKDRAPGPNNIALAAMTERCHRLFPDAWVGAQYEVGVALRSRDTLEPEHIAPAEDWNTAQILEHCVENLPDYAVAADRSVIVISHLHHFGRCARFLRQMGITAAPPPKEVAAYADYDPAEAQPRYRSPWEYLVNDFLSICKTAGSRKGAICETRSAA